MTKPCTKCGTDKPLTEFNRNKASRDGHVFRCRCCTREDSAESMKKINANPERREACLKRMRDRNAAAQADPTRREANIEKSNSGYQIRKMDNRVKKPDMETAAANSRRYRQQNKIKEAARTAVKEAYRLGTLKRQPCHCGEIGEAHHESYDPARWLDVTWLCKKHHGERHREMNKEARRAN